MKKVRIAVKMKNPGIWRRMILENSLNNTLHAEEEIDRPTDKPLNVILKRCPLLLIKH